MSQGKDTSDDNSSYASQNNEASNILEDVLAATLGKSRRSLSDSEWRGLATIVQSHSSQADSNLETLTIRLVESFLSIRFPTTATAPNALTTMSQWIGKTIVTDPYSREQMQALIAQLSRVNCDQ
jgi:RNA polymerase subunit RPABC4/transcription elongation factor Spt4